MNEASQMPITEIMSRHLVTASPTTSVDKVLELLRGQHVGCVPIVDKAGIPLGIVTKQDLVECFGETRKSAREVMMPHAISLDTTATVAQAVAMMSRENIHHLLVIRDGVLVGIVSSLDIVHWVARTDRVASSS